MTVCDNIYAGTGFSEEMRNVFFRLSDEYEILWVSLQHTGYKVDIADREFPDLEDRGRTIKMMGGVGGDLGFSAFKSYFNKYKPDMVFNIGDPHHFIPYARFKNEEAFTFITYTTLDGLPLYPPWKQIFNNVDYPICMTEWANNEFLKAGYKMAAYVHHGVNWNWMSTNQEARNKMKRKYGLEGYTIFGNWESNQFRKRPSALLKAWKAAHPERKKMKLFLNTDTTCRLGNNLHLLVEQYDVPRETVIFPEDLSPTGDKKYFDQADGLLEHKEKIQLIDVYTSSTGGEGFGKGPLEALSLGDPVIITDYSACSEVCRKGSILVPYIGTYRPRDEVKVVDLALIDEEALTEAILYLYHNPAEREEMGIEARTWAQGFDYDTKVLPAWRDVLGRINPDVVLANQLLKFE